MNKEKVREDKEEVLEQEVAKMKEDIEVDEEENGSWSWQSTCEGMVVFSILFRLDSKQDVEELEDAWGIKKKCNSVLF